MNEEDLMAEIYSVRMLCFVETDPQSNKYHQIYLDRETFAKILRLMERPGGLEDSEVKMLKVSDESYPLPDLNQIHYERKGLLNSLPPLDKGKPTN